MGLDANHIKRITGLWQTIKAATRADAILDWCLTNSRENIFQSIQLPPIGTSDHYTILMKAQDQNRIIHQYGNAISETVVYDPSYGILLHLICLPFSIYTIVI